MLAEHVDSTKERCAAPRNALLSSDPAAQERRNSRHPLATQQSRAGRNPLLRQHQDAAHSHFPAVNALPVRALDKMRDALESVAADAGAVPRGPAMRFFAAVFLRRPGLPGTHPLACAAAHVATPRGRVRGAARQQLVWTARGVAARGTNLARALGAVRCSKHGRKGHKRARARARPGWRPAPPPARSTLPGSRGA